MSAGASRLLVTAGDSFTAGRDGERPWPGHAAEMLGCSHVNLAVAGVRTAEVAATQVDPLIELEPDVASLMCGANDVLLTTRPDVAAFAETFGAMLERIRRALPDAWIVTATYPSLSERSQLRPLSRARVTRGLAGVNDSIRRHARRWDALCLDLDGHPAGHRAENVAEDGFHPTAAGHRRLAVEFVRHLGDARSRQDEAIA